MARKFYKKLNPATNVVLGNGAPVIFKTLNHSWGYFSTESEYVQSELDRFMSANQYAITEISEAEFHADYVELKKNGIVPKPLWREEVANGMSIDQRGAASPVAGSAKGAVKSTAEVAAVGGPVKPLQPYAPNVGSRNRPA